MAKKTQSATGQQAQTEPPDQAEQKLPAEQQGGERTRSGRTFRPRVDIRETERGLVLQADVPGLDDARLEAREVGFAQISAVGGGLPGAATEIGLDAVEEGHELSMVAHR